MFYNRFNYWAIGDYPDDGVGNVNDTRALIFNGNEVSDAVRTSASLLAGAISDVVINHRKDGCNRQNDL